MINNAAFGNSGSTANGGDALFNLANDGRFKYMGTLGVAYRNFGLEAKYINLGFQHLTGVNGSGLTKDENGYFSGKYYDLNAVAFIPMNEWRQDFYFMIGGAGSRPISRPPPRRASQARAKRWPRSPRWPCSWAAACASTSRNGPPSICS
ncbi:MAG: hypothetical protein MO853_02955 [Candidatus Protistobacter heckmanni]|nr:hypothetical protein [Candidatus Protistobacter heckmanni]